jgi:hypothetical protein
MAELNDRRRKPQNARRQPQRIPVHLSNRFTPLHNLNEDPEGPRFHKNGSSNKVLSDSVVINDKRKIVIIGDSHARNCAAKLQHQLRRKYSVIGHVKPGAEMKQIVNSGKKEVNNLKGDDVIVVWGGSNDIGKQNSQEAWKHLHNFAKTHQDVNVIVMSAPQRYDLMPSSCVNSEVVRSID